MESPCSVAFAGSQPAPVGDMGDPSGGAYGRLRVSASPEPGARESDSSGATTNMAEPPGFMNTLFPDLQRSIQADISEVNDAIREDYEVGHGPRGSMPGNTSMLKQMEEIIEAQRRHERATMLIEDQVNDGQLNAVQREIKVKVAMDSGSVANVTHPITIPDGTNVAPNTSGENFSGAGGETIIKHGSCLTMMTGQHGQVGCQWQVADVTRPLNSVSQVTGPYDGPGEHDVLFNNQTCVVVPPGIVKQILQQVKPLAEYPRDGNLYVAEMTLSSFTRQGQRA